MSKATTATAGPAAFRFNEKHALSQDEKDLLIALCTGVPQKQAATQLFISVGTVEAALATLRKRFNCATTLQLVAMLLTDNAAAYNAYEI